MKKGSTEMATETKNSLNGRIAATKYSALELKQRVACAWTLARTTLPTAPTNIQLKYAKSLLANTTQVLKVALRQTAINAHNTKLAEQFEDVHKVELNTVVNSAEYTKALAAVKSELKGEAKNAADDRKDAGPQPDAYKEDGRKEPEGLEASKSEDRPKGTINMSEDIKVAAACKGKGCKGCTKCKAKKAADEDEHKEPAAEEHTDETAAETPAEGEHEEEHTEEPTDEPAAEAGEKPAEAGETFDPEKQELQDAIEDTKSEIEHLDEVLDGIGDGEESSSIDDLLSNEETGDDNGDLDAAALEEGAQDIDFGADDLAEGADELADGEQELDLASIFGDDNLESKVSALANEDAVEAAFDGDGFEGLENGAEDDIFGFAPEDAANMEGLLDQEDKIFSAADMFEIPGEGHDPLAAMFASVKQAAGDDVVLPGHLADHFETDIKGADDRDSTTDHDTDLLTEVAESIQAEQRHETRDQTSKLEADKTAAGKRTPVAPKRASMRTLNPSAPTRRVASTNNVDLATLLLGDE